MAHGRHQIQNKYIPSPNHPIATAHKNKNKENLCSSTESILKRLDIFDVAEMEDFPVAFAIKALIMLMMQLIELIRRNL